MMKKAAIVFANQLFETPVCSEVDGGRITTKPYISSSNYIRRMSDFPKGVWCDVWDALFWRFAHQHKEVFANNARLRVMAIQLGRMDKKTLKDHIDLAQRYLQTLFRRR